MRYFETLCLEDAIEFLGTLDPKIVRKILYNIELAEHTNDPKLFKKLTTHIWEFRIQYWGMKIRLLAFWDKTDAGNTLVVATHGFIKKTSKIQSKELERAMRIREKYFHPSNGI